MFVSAIQKAHNAVEGIAVEAAFGLAAVLLACGAVLFAAAGVTMWLSTVMPIYFALFITASVIAVVSGFVYFLGHREVASSEEEEAGSAGASPLAALTKSLGSMAAPMDLVASGLFARQFKKAPLATLAATAAIGAIAGMMASAQDDD